MSIVVEEMPSSGPPLPPGILVDEEISPVYDSKYFYPAKPGVLGSKADKRGMDGLIVFIPELLPVSRRRM
jgi:hypothetical protein